MFLEKYKDFWSVILRFYFGFAILFAGGIFKLTHLEPVSGMFTMLFGGAGTALLWVTIVVEILAGLFLLLGWQTRWTASVLVVVMIVALIATWGMATGDFLFGLKEIFVMNTGGGNTAVNFAWIAGLLALAFGGTEKWAIKPE